MRQQAPPTTAIAITSDGHARQKDLRQSQDPLSLAFFFFLRRAYLESRFLLHSVQWEAHGLLRRLSNRTLTLKHAKFHSDGALHIPRVAFN